MAETARDLLIKLTVDATQADRRLKEIEKSAAGIDGKLSGAAKALKAFAGGAVAGAAIAAIGQGFRTMADSIKSSIDSMDEMAKASQKIGVAVESLSELNYVASQSGVSFDTLQNGLKRLNANLADVETGTSAAAKAMRALGVTGADSPQEALKKMADAFAAVPDGAKKTALAMEIFGKAGADMIPLLNAGSAGIAELEERARRLGVTLDTETAKNAERFNDNLSDMKVAMDSIVRSISAGMLPAFVNITNEIANSARVSGDWKKVGAELGQIIGQLAGKTYYLVTAFKASAYSMASWKQAVGLVASGEFKQALLVIQTMTDTIKRMDAEAKEVSDRLAAPLQAVAVEAPKAADGVTRFNAAARATQTAVGGKNSAIKETSRAMQEYAAAQERLNAIDAEARALGNQFLLDQAAKAEAFEQQVQALRESVNPLIEFNRNQELYNQLMQEGRLTLEEYDLLLERNRVNMLAAKRALEGQTEAVKQNDDMFKSLKDAIDGYGKSMAGAFVNAIASGQSFKESFKQITADILKNMAQLILQKTVFDKLFASFGGGAGGGLLGSIGKFLGFSQGGAFSSNIGLPFGVYNQPTFFQMPGSGPLQKFARGGVLGEAGPEAIMPLSRGSDGKLGVSAAPVNVNVINNAGASVSVEREGDDINIVIERVRSALTRDVRSGGNAFAGALQATYGLNRAHA